MIRATLEVDGQVLILEAGEVRPDLLVALRHDRDDVAYDDDIKPRDMVAPLPMRVLLRGEDIGRVVNVHVDGENIFAVGNESPMDFIVHATRIDLVMELQPAPMPILR